MPESQALTGEHLQQRFMALDAFLLAHQELWRGKPFTNQQLPWMRQHPELADWLGKRSLAQAEAAHNHPEQLAAPAPFPQLAQQAALLSAIEDLPQQNLPPLASRLSVDVPGRKWQQIQAFSGSLQFSQPAHH